MTGKLCLVTGATSGIGAATALSLARQGAAVIGVGRDPAKCRGSLDRLRREAGRAPVEFFLADLSSQREIRRLARQFKERHRQLDILVNNAGARFSSRQLTADGVEMTFALNHLGYFLLTDLLLEELRASGHGRIVNVSSSAHWGCPGIDFDNLQGERSYSGRKAYAQSKLANLLFTYELDRRLKGCAVTVNAVDPGNVLTNFCRNNGLIAWGRHILGSLKSGSLVGAEEGARTSVYLACSSEMEGVSGKYFQQGRMARSSEASYDAEAARRLWEISVELTKPRPHRP